MPIVYHKTKKKEEFYHGVRKEFHGVTRRRKKKKIYDRV
jgi:hypothetical protein